MEPESKHGRLKFTITISAHEKGVDTSIFDTGNGNLSTAEIVGAFEYAKFEYLRKLNPLHVIPPPEEHQHPVEATTASSRARNSLFSKNVFYLTQLEKYSKGELSKFRGMGAGTLDEIRTLMRKHNLKLRGEA